MRGDDQETGGWSAECAGLVSDAQDVFGHGPDAFVAGGCVVAAAVSMNRAGGNEVFVDGVVVHHRRAP